MSAIIGITVGTPTSPEKIAHDIEPEIKEYIDEQLGDVEAALDSIISLQNSLIGGDGV